MKEHVSQRSLAALAGVSPMTVSLALRGHPSISAKTRKKIEDLARKHDYRPDPALSALNAYRVRNAKASHQGVLAWLTAFSTRDGWREMIQAQAYFEGARACADKLGYRMEEFWAMDPAISPKRLTQIFLSRGVRGIVVAPLPPKVTSIDLAWEHFSAVALGYSLQSPCLHTVMNNQFRNMKQAVQKLHERGYRRIGMAMPLAKDERVDHNYLAGYWVGQHTLESGAAKLDPLLVSMLDEKAFCVWVRKAKPDAVVVSASMAHDIIGWLKSMKLRVPRDVGVCVASIPYGDDTISGINENAPAVGAHAVETVVGMIHRNERGVPERRFSLLLEGEWVDGKTVSKTPAVL